MSNRIDLTFRISGGAQTWSPCADSEMMTNADVDHDDEKSVDDGENHLREDGVMYDELSDRGSEWSSPSSLLSTRATSFQKHVEPSPTTRCVQ